MHVRTPDRTRVPLFDRLSVMVSVSPEPSMVRTGARPPPIRSVVSNVPLTVAFERVKLPECPPVSVMVIELPDPSIVRICSVPPPGAEETVYDPLIVASENASVSE